MTKKTKKEEDVFRRPEYTIIVKVDHSIKENMITCYCPELDIRDEGVGSSQRLPQMFEAIRMKVAKLKKNKRKVPKPLDYEIVLDAVQSHLN